MNKDKKTLILTGGSSGIGRATAILFAQKGNYQVYELSRHGESTDGIRHIDCDVTNPEDCHNAVSKAIEETGKIDLLISNAGMGISGALEFTELSEAKRQMDVNLFGTLNITQAVLPYMREHRSGKIIFVSSLAAVFSIPFQAFYSASKAAVNSLALALKNEVEPFGIKVAILLPGDVKTGFTAARKKSLVGSDIYKRMEKSLGQMEHDEQSGIAPEVMAKKLYSIAESKSPVLFNTTGIIYHIFILLGKLLPTTLAYKIVGKMY